MPTHFGAQMGAASTQSLAAWLRVSRNRVNEIITECGLTVGCGKHPWRRAIEAVLGIQVTEQNARGLLMPMTTLAEAASELGKSSERLKLEIELGESDLPPMYVLSERRRLFISSQFEAYIRSPKGAFPAYSWIGGHPFSIKFGHGEENDSSNAERRPHYIILAGGERRYRSNDAAKNVEKTSQLPAVDAMPTKAGGILARAASFTGSRSQPNEQQHCTADRQMEPQCHSVHRSSSNVELP